MHLNSIESFAFLARFLYSVRQIETVTKVPILKEVNFGKMQLCRVEHFLNTSSTFFSSKLDSPVIKTLERENLILMINMLKKCSTRQSCIFPKFTSYKIGTLVNKNGSRKEIIEEFKFKCYIKNVLATTFL